jgi:hypothetical protein
MEQQAGGVCNRTDAGMRGIHLSGIRLHIADEFVEVVGRKVLPRRDHDRQAGDHSDRLEIDIRPVGEVRIERHRGSMRPHLTDLDGVAVGSGAHRSGRAGGATRPDHILDDELLPERAREVLTDDAANNVGRSAGSERNDHSDRPRRIGLRASDARDNRQRGGASGQVQKISAGEFHWHPPP